MLGLIVTGILTFAATNIVVPFILMGLGVILLFESGTLSLFGL
jgi:cadmium resistance protein CadD (predicted permease)